MQQCLLLLKFRLIPYPGSPLAITGLLAVKQSTKLFLIVSLLHLMVLWLTAWHTMPAPIPLAALATVQSYLYQTLPLKENIRHRSVTRKSHDFPRLYRNQYSTVGWVRGTTVFFTFFSPNLNVAIITIQVLWIFL